jgi:hypothetical protein
MEKRILTSNEVKKLSKVVYGSVEKQNHQNLKEVVTIIKSAELSELYNQFSKEVKVSELISLNDNFEKLFNDIKRQSDEFLKKAEIDEQIVEKNQQLKDIYNLTKNYHEIGYNKSVKITDLGKNQIIDSNTAKKAVDLKAELDVLKKAEIETRKKIKEIQEEALLEARKKYNMYF